MAEYDKTVLLDLMKQPGNNRCIDCNAPMPQWASVNHGIFVCLNCSGEHRSLGVHISFVRSLTMDKWSPEQIKKMQVGGNSKALTFFQASPGYSPSMSITEKYNTHFASQYRERLLCDIEGRTFVPSAAPPASASGSSLRKPRSTTDSGRTSPGVMPSSGGSRSSTPTGAASGMGGAMNPYSQKSANEDFFAGLGASNASRPDNLHPSQGGKYGGFGSSSSSSSFSAGGASSSSPPSSGMSSRALPSLNDVQQDPLRAFSKGWGFFSTAVSAATQSINESVIQPGLSRAADPDLQSQLYGYVSGASKLAAESARMGGQLVEGGLRAGSGYARQQGYDVGDLGADYIGKYTHADAQRGQYASLAGQTSLESQEAGAALLGSSGQQDFFDDNMGGGGSSGYGSTGYSAQAAPAPAAAPTTRAAGRKPFGAQKAAAKPKSSFDDDDDWGKFD